MLTATSSSYAGPTPSTFAPTVRTGGATPGVDPRERSGWRSALPDLDHRVCRRGDEQGMTAHQVRIKPDTYIDSVLLMSATRKMREAPGVEWASALMGTESNVESLASEGFESEKLSGVRANDLVLAARAGSKDEAAEAMDAGEAALTE